MTDAPPGKNSQASPARMAALATLENLYRPSPQTKDLPLPVLLDDQCHRFHLDERDSALATELVCGVLRTEKTLSARLRPYVRKPDSLPAPMRILLHMAVYELLHLDHIPPRATLHQTVAMARRRFGQPMGGLTNAVLRAFLRDFSAMDAMPTPGNLTLPGSLPDWLTLLWQEQYGPEAVRNFARHSGERPEPSYRLSGRPHDHLTANASIDLRLELKKLGGVEVGEHGMVFPQHRDDNEVFPARQRRLAELEREGQLTRQGLGSLLTVDYITRRIVSEKSLLNAPLWDACCGRGGKTCALLEQGIRVTLASDPSDRRLEDLRTAVTRLHLIPPDIRHANVAQVAADIAASVATCVAKTEPSASNANLNTPAQVSANCQDAPLFPLILLDAPCSNTGTLARNPELRLRLTPERLAAAAQLQGELLRAAWPALAPGGLLFYVTCALNTAENEEQAAVFVKTTPGANLLEQQLFLPSFSGQDFLFLAVLRKEGRTDE